MYSRFVKVGGSSRFVVIRVKILGALCNDTYALLHSQRPQKWSLLLIQYLRIPLRVFCGHIKLDFLEQYSDICKI